MGFERVGDLRVEVLPRAAKQAAMRRVLDQRVLEAIDRVRRRPALEHQLRGDEPAESGFQLVLGKTGDGMHQWKGKLASDRGPNLRDQPHRRQSVEPRHQRIV